MLYPNKIKNNVVPRPRLSGTTIYFSPRHPKKLLQIDDAQDSFFGGWVLHCTIHCKGYMATFLLYWGRKTSAAPPCIISGTSGT